MSTAILRSVLNGPLSLSSIAQLVKPPGVYKYAFYLLLLINARSLPLAWHARVFLPVVRIRLRHFLVFLRFWLFNRRSVRKVKMEKWFESLPLLGRNPFEAVITYSSWASIDDSDFNGHLSNSSYAKTFDAARFKAALAYVPSFLRAGGWIALGATNYHFIREIPMLARYEVRISLIGWDNKWIFAVGRYVTHTKPKSKSRSSKTPPDTYKASLRTPSSPLDTPAPNSTSSSSTALDALVRAQAQQPEPDGATLHCIAISQLCFKHGRITVPPAVVFAADGLCGPPPAGSGLSAYSHESPPPHWEEVQRIRSPLHGGSQHAFRKFLRGGWREVPEGERWWEDALGGEIEERRKRYVGVLDGLRTGMEGARGMY